MKFVSTIVVLVIALELSSSELLRCDYIRYDEDGYNCKMLNELDDQTEVTAVSQEHKYGKEDNGVETLFVSSQNPTKYLPTNICGHFPNITKFDIYAKSIVEVSKNIFEGCSKLQTIHFKYLNLTTLNADLFSGTPTLQNVMFYDSFLEYLPKDLFKNNENIVSIKFDNNNLKVVELELSETQISKIKDFSFLTNRCISKGYKSSDYRSPTLSSVIQELAQECRNNSTPTPTPLVENPNEQRIQILEKKVEKFDEIGKNLMEEIENTYQKLSDSLNKTKFEIGYLKYNLNNFTDYIKTNLSVEVEGVKANYEKFNSDTQKITDKTDEMMEKIQETLKLKTENAELQSKIDHNGNLLIATFAVQMVTVAFAVAITIYLKFSS